MSALSDDSTYTFLLTTMLMLLSVMTVGVCYLLQGAPLVRSDRDKQWYLHQILGVAELSSGFLFIVVVSQCLGVRFFDRVRSSRYRQ